MKYLPMLIGRLSLLPRTQDMFHGRQSTLKKNYLQVLHAIPAATKERLTRSREETL